MQDPSVPSMQDETSLDHTNSLCVVYCFHDYDKRVVVLLSHHCLLPVVCPEQLLLCLLCPPKSFFLFSFVSLRSHCSFWDSIILLLSLARRTPLPSKLSVLTVYNLGPTSSLGLALSDPPSAPQEQPVHHPLTTSPKRCAHRPVQGVEKSVAIVGQPFTHSRWSVKATQGSLLQTDSYDCTHTLLSLTRSTQLMVEMDWKRSQLVWLLISFNEL
jgi:hypothetical protein